MVESSSVPKCPVSSVLQQNTEGKTLFAIATTVTERNRKTGRRKEVAEIIYTHADNESEARWIFGQDPYHRKHKIIAVAPAVGFMVNDNHGDDLTA